MLTRAQPALQPVLVGERCEREIRLSREDIADFARLSGDSNPLHHDVLAAQRARHGEIIASGQQVGAQLMGLAASHFSRPDEGFVRELLCLNVNLAFKSPVFADQAVLLSWVASQVEWHAGLGGWLLHCDGRAAVRHAPAAAVARGTYLVKAVPVQPVFSPQ